MTLWLKTNVSKPLDIEPSGDYSPIMSVHKRDMVKEAKWQSSPEQKARRAARGRARFKLMKLGKVKVGDGKEVDHKNFNPNDNRSSNLRVVSRAVNRRKQPKHKIRKA